MGLFGFIKNQIQQDIVNDIVADSLLNPNAARFEYIYGFVNGNPERHSSDMLGFGELSSIIIGKGGGITIGAAMHPYQALHPETNIWASCLDYIKASNCVDLAELARDSSTYHMNPPQQLPFLPVADTRLLPKVNPDYGRFVPYLIPYITFSTQPLTCVEYAIKDAVSKFGNANDYMNSISEACSFLFRSNMPNNGAEEASGHNMPIGFGIYTPGQESLVVDDFERFRNSSLFTFLKTHAES